MNSEFIMLKCPRCSKNKITYGKASTWVKCNNCNKLLIKPNGGKAKVRAQIKEILK